MPMRSAPSRRSCSSTGDLPAEEGVVEPRQAQVRPPPGLGVQDGQCVGEGLGEQAHVAVNELNGVVDLVGDAGHEAPQRSVLLGLHQLHLLLGEAGERLLQLPLARPQPPHDCAGDGHRGAHGDEQREDQHRTERALGPRHGRDAGESVAGQDRAPLEHHQREEQPEGAGADRPRRAPREEHHPSVCVDEVEADQRARAAPHEVEKHREGDEVEADLQARLEAAAGRNRVQPPLVTVIGGEEDVVDGDDHRHGQRLADREFDPEEFDRDSHGEHQPANEEPAHPDEPPQQPPQLGLFRRLGCGVSPIRRRLGRPEHDGAGADLPPRFTLQCSQDAPHRGAIMSHRGYSGALRPELARPRAR